MTKPQMLPRLSRVEFFRSREDELPSLLAWAIANHAEQLPNAERTDDQAAISAWSAVSIDVSNGGFTQFFYNRRGDHGIAELTALLDALDFPKVATILRDAADVYQQHRDKFKVGNPWDGLFGSIQEFEKLERSFEKATRRCHRVLDVWIRDHITELATDELGAPIDAKFTGTVEIRYPNGQIKESLEVRKGKPHGVYREFFEDGCVRDGVLYEAGKISGEFWPNGQLKRKQSKQGKNQLIEWFYSTGAIQKRYVKDKDGFAAEPIRLFHENGQLAEELTTANGDKIGPWLKFFDDGTPELQAEYVADEKLIVRNAWNEKRKQVVKNGTGLFRDYSAHIDWEYDIFFENGWPRESELKKGIPHGKVTTYSYGMLWSIAHYVHGKPDGEWTTYWDNGRIRSVTNYVKGNEGASQEFPKFDHPVPAVLLSVEANEKLHMAWRHVQVDEFPCVLNLKQVQIQLKVPQFLHEVNERNLAGKLQDNYEDCNTFDDGIAYFLTVDISGEVTCVTANGSGVYSGGDWNTYPPFLQKLRFTPGRIRGRAIECQVLARVDHRFVEGESEHPRTTTQSNARATTMKKKKDESTKGMERDTPSDNNVTRVKETSDWRPAMLARLRTLIQQADPDVVEEVKWRKPSNGMAGVPVWSRGGIICTGETYKQVVKLTFMKGASLPDPAGLFNSSLEGNTRRAIDFHEGDAIDEPALQALIRAAVALNTSAPATARPARARKKSGSA